MYNTMFAVATKVVQLWVAQSSMIRLRADDDSDAE